MAYTQNPYATQDPYRSRMGSNPSLGSYLGGDYANSQDMSMSRDSALASDPYTQPTTATGSDTYGRQGKVPGYDKKGKKTKLQLHCGRSTVIRQSRRST